MATYDFEGMFGDRYSTEQAINSAMFNEAMSFGQLDRSKYAPMTASSYGQAYMGGAGMGQMLGGQHPMMQRQNVLDAIQKAFPDPRTPEELNKLAAELSKNGFGDLAMQVRQVSMEMSKNEATKAYQTTQVNAASGKWFDKIPDTLTGSVLNTDITNAYLRLVEPSLEKWDKNGIWKDNRQGWKDGRTSRMAEVKSLIDQFANNYHVAGITKQQIQTAIGDDAALTEEFFKWIETNGNRDVADNLLIANKRKDAPSSGTTTTQTETGSEANLGAGQAVEVNDTNFPITSKWTDKTAKYHWKRIDGLIIEGKELQPNDKKIYEELKRRFPTTVAMANVQPVVEDWWMQGAYS